MLSPTSLISLSLLAVASAQQIGTLTAESHPKITWKRCTASGCTSVQGSVVLDANWRWTHTTSGSTNCYDGNTWDTSLCPDGKTCAEKCAIDGADYAGTYGITTSGDSISHTFVTKHQYGTSVGSRVYLLDTSDSKYEKFMVLNKEFTFDVDVSTLPCGLNGALYFVDMDADGGTSRFSTNKAGAKYGTGYCDAQCPHDIKFINGEANVDGWAPSADDPNAGKGRYGTCCAEMDIWEANSISTAYTPHPCSVTGQYRCTGTECGDGPERYLSVCDKDGCDFNSYRMGNTSFYGPGKIVDTGKKITVVTQFITGDGTDNGDLTEIRRLYVQDGRVIQNSKVSVPGIPEVNSITDSFCEVQKQVFGDQNQYKALGAMKRMGESLKRGGVLAMSIWDDYEARMLWLDSDYPLDKDPSEPGVSRGTCSRESGKPKEVEAQHPNAKVTFSNIRFGTIGSTYGSGSTNPSPSNPASTTTSAAAPTSTQAPGGTIPRWGQCGGRNWNGSGTCVSGSTCTVLNEYYHQCL